MTVTIRGAQVEDAGALLDLIHRHAAHERAAASVTLPVLYAMLANPALFIFIAEDGGRLLGYAALTLDWSLWSGARYGHMDCLFVVETARSRGIGKLLLEAALDKARQEGVARMEWQTPEWNRGAERFYLREGAQRSSKIRFSMTL